MHHVASQRESWAWCGLVLPWSLWLPILPIWLPSWCWTGLRSASPVSMTHGYVKQGAYYYTLPFFNHINKYNNWLILFLLIVHQIVLFLVSLCSWETHQTSSSTPQWNKAQWISTSGGRWSLAPCTATWRSTTMRVPPRLSRPCVTSESRPGRADQSTCRPAVRPIKHIDQGYSS